MKTEIDLPEDLLRDARALAKRLGLGLDALHAAALDEFVRRHRVSVRETKPVRPGDPALDEADRTSVDDLQDVSFSRVEYKE
jgi:hypothetical protein